MKSIFFYIRKDNKTFVSTYATFLEKDYMMKYKSKSGVTIEEIIGKMSIYIL